ncbi:hypothetical protein [Devosia sp. MC521]|uniref:hypothetical protein n=1 Tax=Devosia sp. MC521 TaxID=2759954 RepID=UPI0015FE5146|nr:hypothetical protein [Devosia sp. MC521]MBJ6989114.1 hypothetical protein [Devosia sp. MC521]QMW63315.1 hypothetical protein H4N61_02950 [Devosia sp. MC521]
MATGRYVTDLDVGDVLGPVEYTLSSFVIREYSHIVEMHHECFQGADGLIMPPTLIHLDKLRLYNAACPEGTGPTARIHYEYDAEVFAPARVGDKLSVIGRIKDRYLKKGREYVLLEMELTNVETGELLVRYRDQVILAYAQKPEASA